MSGQKGKPPRNTAAPKIRGLSQEDEGTVRGPPQQELSVNGEGRMKLKGCNEEELVWQEVEDQRMDIYERGSFSFGGEVYNMCIPQKQKSNKQERVWAETKGVVTHDTTPQNLQEYFLMQRES